MVKEASVAAWNVGAGLYEEWFHLHAVIWQSRGRRLKVDGWKVEVR